MPRHPTTTHAAADHRQDHLTEAAAHWHRRPDEERLRIRRRTQLLWRVSTARDGVLSWLTREFMPSPHAADHERHPGRPLSISAQG